MVLSCNIYFWRQMFIATVFFFCNMSGGIFLAFPSVLNAGILNPNATDIKATLEEASWIAASCGLSAIPSHAILPIIMQHYGRKCVTLSYCAIATIGWLVFVFAQNTTALLVARIIQGIPLGSGIIEHITIAEYVHPERRGYMIATMKLFFGIGALLCHLLFLVWSWRQIAVVASITTFTSFVLVFFWPESPAFLSIKNRFEECEKSFLWLHGRDSTNKKELQDLITSQETKLKNGVSRKPITHFFKIFLEKDFQISFFSLILLGLLLETTGGYTFPAYLIQIMVELLGNESAAVYVTIGNDVLSLIASFVAIPAVWYFTRRTLLFCSGWFSVILMFVICTIIFVKSYYPLRSLDWLVAIVILLFTFVTCMGVVSPVFALLGELFSLELRGIGASLVGMIWAGIFGMSLKVTPILLLYAGLSGTFMINASLAIVCLLVLNFILPETKDKPLMDIEMEIKGVEKPCEEITPMI